MAPIVNPDLDQPHYPFGKSRTRSQQRFELTTGLEVLVSAKGWRSLVGEPVAVAPTLDDPAVGATARGFAAKVHDWPRVQCAQRLIIRANFIMDVTCDVPLSFSLHAY